MLSNISRTLVNNIVLKLINLQTLFNSLEEPVYHWRKMLFVLLTISALEQEDLLQLSILLKMKRTLDLNPSMHKQGFHECSQQEDNWFSQVGKTF